MRFWDSSALVPLFIEQPASAAVRQAIQDDPEVAYWWASPAECWSAFARLRREGGIDAGAESRVLGRLEAARGAWLEILPHEALRRRAGQLLRVHALRAADALQLAAALAWGEEASGALVTFDERLALAARLEGFEVVPG
ncbi:MAG TPA: type II toxin-antitoxin system VapC family toxin [Longimicrobiales bacterium]|nr:type II toxin-antitoxin system VapC family toxin [Longimicrobiales bacterium]